MFAPHPGYSPEGCSIYSGRLSEITDREQMKLSKHHYNAFLITLHHEIYITLDPNMSDYLDYMCNDCRRFTEHKQVYLSCKETVQ